jgi:hypothetical protein
MRTLSFLGFVVAAALFYACPLFHGVKPPDMVVWAVVFIVLAALAVLGLGLLAYSVSGVNVFKFIP